MNALGVTYLVLGSFALLMGVVHFIQAAYIRSDVAEMYIAGTCMGFALFDIAIAFSSELTGAPHVPGVPWLVIGGLGGSMLTMFVPLQAWSLLDAKRNRPRAIFFVVTNLIAMVRFVDLAIADWKTPGLSWEDMNCVVTSPLSLPMGLVALSCTVLWAVEGAIAWRRGHRLGLAMFLLAFGAMFAAGDGVLVSFRVLAPPDLFGLMALPAILFIHIVSSVRFVNAMRTANKPSGDMARYQVIEKLGSGGMGDVFLARRKGPAGFLREVVLKTLHSSPSNPDARERFLAEARVAAQLRHPNIVDVYDLGEQPQGFFIVMERIDGPTLFQLLQATISSGRRVPPTIVAELGAQLCRALGYAHAARIIHRDLKPQNVMVSFAGVAKLIDFGIAQEQQPPLTERPTLQKGAPQVDTLTQEEGIVGTQGYIPPERMRGAAATVSSDLFALGVVLYEMLALESPFPQREGLAYTYAAERGEYPRLAERRPDCPPALGEIVEQCLSAEPSRRPASAAALSAALEAYLGDHRVDIVAWVHSLFPGATVDMPTSAPTTPVLRSDLPTTPERAKLHT